MAARLNKIYDQRDSPAHLRDFIAQNNSLTKPVKGRALTENANLFIFSHRHASIILTAWLICGPLGINSIEMIGSAC